MVTRAHAQDIRVATHYGTSYNGSPLGCSGYGAYSSNNTTIAALSYNDISIWPCGTHLLIEGAVGSINVIVQDTCPGCTNQVDLSEAGITAVCGGLGSCRLTVGVIYE